MGFRKMTNNFKIAFKEIIGIEGGYVNNPNDRGGETKYGISKRAYPNLDIKNLTLQNAQDIYYKDYWSAIKLDYVEDLKIALELFDTAVNMGIRTASKMFQEALNLLNRNGSNFSDLTIDGDIGSKTITAYIKVDKAILLKVLNGLQFKRYVEIVEKDSRQEVFFNGWMKRV
jgi:lysozyme family protein